MDNNYDKPFKTIDEMIELLSERNVEFEDINFAKSTLQSLSYYTIINGYKNSFLSIPGTDSFKPGTRFEELYALHIIDTSLSSVILKNILYVERYLKTRISYLVSKKYGVYTDFHDLSSKSDIDYLSRYNYSNSTNRRKNTLRSLKKSLTSRKRNSIVTHYIANKNHIPPWILVTNITFGLVIDWYVILKGCDKSCICEQFLFSDSIEIEAKKEFFKAAITMLKDYRNIIAHGNRLFQSAANTKLPKRQLIEFSHNAVSSAEYDSKHGQNDLFAAILAIFILIDDEYLLLNFYHDLQYVLIPYKDVKISNASIYNTFNLPDDLFKRLDQYISEKA
ncbi:MAG: Abi family protein [Anaerostipes sp.]